MGSLADIQDVFFLLQQGIIDLDRLCEMMDWAMPFAWNYNADPATTLFGGRKHYLSGLRISFHIRRLDVKIAMKRQDNP